MVERMFLEIQMHNLATFLGTENIDWPQGAHVKIEVGVPALSTDKPAIILERDGGELGMMIREQWIWFDEYPLKIHYRLDGPEGERLVMTGLLDTPQGKIREAAKLLRLVKTLDKKQRGGRPRLTKSEIEERAQIVQRIEERAARLGITLEQSCARDPEIVPYDTYQSWKRLVKNRMT
jgi:hypothetical protein